MRNLILPFILILTFIFSCTENETDENLSQKTASYDVYVAGRENNKACYWKNNVKTDLSSGDDLLSMEIKVENNNVYVTGSTGSNPVSYKTIQYFWKNNIRTEIRQYLNIPNSAQSNITGFTVSNGDIYFAGYIENLTPASSLDRYELCYWKNGTKTILHKSQYISSAEAIFVGGSDVYVSALIVFNNQNTERGYFKNTVFQSLNQPDYVHNFAKNSNGLHILYNKNSKFYSKNINNNAETLIGDYTSSLPFYGKIASDNSTNDLYTTYFNYGTSYFKNNSIINPNFSILPYIQDLFVLDDNVYMIKYDAQNATYNGKVYINGVESQSINSSQNGTLNYFGTFNSIYVVEN